MEGQRYGFQMELEKVREGFQMELGKVREELYQVEARSTTLECEINAQKSQKQSPKPRPTQDMLAMKNVSIIPPSTKLPKRKEPVNSPYKSYAQIAASGSPKIATEKACKEVTSSSYRQKATTPNMPKVEPEKRIIIFHQEALSPQKSEADLMLALNESLQKGGIPAFTRFSSMGYSQSGAISALFTEKSSTEQLVKNHSNIIIRVAKAVDVGVIGVKALERWQRLKVHGMSLARYLGEGKMEVLCREIESSTGIQLKTVPCWLISESQLEKRLESGTGRGSAIVITVGTSEEASKLCSGGLRFGGALKVVEKYWEARPSSVCLSCAGIGHDCLGECKNRAVQYVICAGAHKVQDHRCGVIGCTMKMGKICTHVTPKCANCGAKHQATTFRCPARLKAQAEAWKEKSRKSQAKNKEATTFVASEEEPEAGSSEMEVDTSLTLWTKDTE